ncbi:MAG: cysteine hydrolase [Burkholderiales bacterium]|nr:cysteine hydrolase [Burkholderiales bacterium]
MNTALLIIDVQHALCTGEEAAFDIEAVVERINTVSTKARAAGVPVVLIQHEETEGTMQFGSEGWQLHASLAVHSDDLRIRKTVPDSFHKTALQALLQSHGVGSVVICGLQSDYCVDSTVRGALAHGYPVTLVADGHSTLDNGVLTAAQISAHHNKTLRGIGSFGAGVTLKPAAEVVFGG